MNGVVDAPEVSHAVQHALEQWVIETFSDLYRRADALDAVVRSSGDTAVAGSPNLMAIFVDREAWLTAVAVAHMPRPPLPDVQGFPH